MSRIDQPRMIRALRRYFASGWAFLIPYLAVYLLYYVTDWPVNPTRDSASGEGPVSAMPSLLHMYWALHAVHLALGMIALWASPNAKSEERKVKGEKNAPGGGNLGRALHHQQLRAMSSELLATIIRRVLSRFPLRASLFHRPSPFTLHAFLFWLLLALIFYIPGVYLEWPSDPWEHLRRINEWHATATVGGHSCWYKSAYFIPYSLLSWATGLRQLFWLDFYYTGICLLLCWQYYRLARACGLGERASMIFVLTQAILFGNNIFSFYRYYGISSSIYAQIGAVAITRIALEFATRGTSQEQHSGWPASENIRARAFWHWPTLLKAILPAIACLVPFVAFNHQQGIGIAALGVLAIVIWRTIEWRRRALWWIIAGTLIFNALFLWLYPKPPVIEIYRANGALNAWYGFNIFDFTHPIGDRMLQIVSAFGLVSILAALLLLRRNHVSAWLTITPLIALSLPCISIPFATVLSKQGVGNIITFQRMLFAIPLGIAVASNVQELTKQENKMRHRRASTQTLPTPLPRNGIRTPSIYIIACSTIALLPLATSARSPYYNRMWHAITFTPEDLCLRDILLKYDQHKIDKRGGQTLVVTNQLGAALKTSYGAALAFDYTRTFGFPISEIEKNGMLAFLRDHEISSSDRLSALIKPAIPEPKRATTLVAAVGAIRDSDWMTTGGLPPEFVVRNGEGVLQNPQGKASYTTTSALIPIQQNRSYKLEVVMRQASTAKGKVSLLVTWFDNKHQLLLSNIEKPAGAGFPIGWINGYYSYFGLHCGYAPREWTRYTKEFGANQIAAIPSNATHIRIGAVLNYDEVPNAQIQLASVRLFQVPPPCSPTAIILATPSPSSAYSHASLAATLSGHWATQQVSVNRSGTHEIASATKHP